MEKNTAIAMLVKTNNHIHTLRNQPVKGLRFQINGIHPFQ